VYSRLLSLTLSSTLVALAAAPAPAFAQGTSSSAQSGSQTPQTQSTAAPQSQATSAPQAPQPAATGGAAPTQPMQPQSGGGSSSSGMPTGGSNQEGLPPPPMPPVLPTVPNVAPGYAANSNAPLPSGDLVGVQQLPFVGIKLDDAVTMGLQRNTDLAISSSQARIANYQIVAAKGLSDVEFMLQPSYAHEVTPATSPFATGPSGGPVTQIQQGVQGGFRAQTPYGTQVALTGSASSTFNNSVYNSYNPFYQTAIGLSVTQPLLRGRGTSAEARQIALASANAQVQQAQLLVQASQTITNVSDTYWDLVAAWRDVAIQEEGLREAQAQAESNTRLARRGAVAPVEIVESNTQVNVFQDNVFSALQNVQRLQTQLKSLILGSPGDPLWSANLVPTSAVIQLPTEPKLDDLIVTALRNRPEIAQLRASRLSAATNLAYAKNQLLPQLDLNASATENGFAGVPQNLDGTPLFQTLGGEINSLNALIAEADAGMAPGDQIPLVTANFGSTPTYQNGRYGQAWTNLFDSRYPTYVVSLTLSFPLRNRTAKADYAIAKEQATQVAVQEIALLQRVRSDAVNAIQTLRETQYRLVAASAARAASERVLLSEQRKFRVGNSTTFLVLQRQLELANNRGRELQAQTDLNKAVVELNRVAGTDFAANNIDASRLGGQTFATQTPTGSNLPPK
jgi:HAE1 family hydrophobic/amphiphilic exporter-1